MNPFEMKDTRHKLRDANDRPIEVLPLPSEEHLEALTLQTIGDSPAEQIRLITNIANEVAEDEEGWAFSDVPAEVTRLTVEKIMIELTGESWFSQDREDGYSIGEIIDMLSSRAFVQLSELTAANVEACLEQNGKIIAYFPDLVWREYFDQLPALPTEVLGMRTVEIESMTGGSHMVINDLSSANGSKMQLDMTSFAWLSKGGWMLEVYK